MPLQRQIRIEKIRSVIEAIAQNSMPIKVLELRASGDVLIYFESTNKTDVLDPAETAYRQRVLRKSRTPKR